MCIKIGKLAIISDDYHDIGRLLLLTIIVNSKNWTILIIVKENITVNRQNRLIAHPYSYRRITLQNDCSIRSTSAAWENIYSESEFSFSRNMHYKYSTRKKLLQQYQDGFSDKILLQDGCIKMCFLQKLYDGSIPTINNNHD